MEVVQAVLAGTVNKNLVRLIQQAGGKAVGLCGIDSGLIMASQVTSLRSCLSCSFS
jgi:acetylglutamate kinase